MQRPLALRLLEREQTQICFKSLHGHGQAARLQAVLLAQHVVDLLRHTLQLHALVGARLIYQVDRLVRQEAALRGAFCTLVA